VNVRPQRLQIPRRILIQSCVSSWACLRRRPCPIIESHVQMGQVRIICLAAAAAQSSAGLSDGAESGIKRIVLSGGPPAKRTLLGSAHSGGLPLLENPTGKEYQAPFGCCALAGQLLTTGWTPHHWVNYFLEEGELFLMGDPPPHPPGIYRFRADCC